MNASKMLKGKLTQLQAKWRCLYGGSRAQDGAGARARARADGVGAGNSGRCGGENYAGSPPNKRKGRREPVRKTSAARPPEHLPVEETSILPLSVRAAPEQYLRIGEDVVVEVANAPLPRSCACGSCGPRMSAKSKPTPLRSPPPPYRKSLRVDLSDINY
jgi:hypothetical protein